ncbi:hypothetical protein D9M68_778020 [compost metagenome]
MIATVQGFSDFAQAKKAFAITPPDSQPGIPGLGGTNGFDQLRGGVVFLHHCPGFLIIDYVSVYWLVSRPSTKAREPVFGVHVS